MRYRISSVSTLFVEIHNYWPDHEILILNLVSVDHFKKDSEAINNILKDLVILSFG